MNVGEAITLLSDARKACEEMERRDDVKKNRAEFLEKCHLCESARLKGGICGRGHLDVFKNEELLKLCLGNYLQLSSDFEDRCVGALLAVCCGDALGAPFEGKGSRYIRQQLGLSREDEDPFLFVPGLQMGIHAAGLRWGMFTDDTNSTLGLAAALVDNQGVVDLQCVAQSYVKFWRTLPLRGYPDSAIKALKEAMDGIPARRASMSSFSFGSFANGAAMRIAPLAFVLPSNDAQTLKGLVAECVAGSHVHYDALDAAVVVVATLRTMLELDTQKPLDGMWLLQSLQEWCPKESAMWQKLEQLKVGLLSFSKEFADDDDEEVTDDEFLATCTDNGFQLYAPDAVATALWILVRHVNSKGPEKSLMRCVGLGGDCDTTGAILGAFLGARYGTGWIPVRWYGLLENGTHGRDYIVQLGKNLAAQKGKGRCCEENMEFFKRPLFEIFRPIEDCIRKRLGAVKQHYKLREESFGSSLWEELYAIAADEHGMIRCDVAVSLLSFFGMGCIPSNADEIIGSKRSFDKETWLKMRPKQ